MRRTVAVCPDWVESAIGAAIARKMSREIWPQWVEQQGIQMLAIDTWSCSYRGEIVQMNDRDILQIVGEDVVMHDRLLLKSDCAIDQMLSISYCEGVGSIAESSSEDYIVLPTNIRLKIVTSRSTLGGFRRDD
jgi:hypothetical protein